MVILLRPRLPTVTLAMIVRDEEALLGSCLDAARPHVDEIVVVDTGSTDATREIARAYDAAVFDHAWADDFAEARNVALGAATSEWIVVLDADDRLLPAGAHALKCALAVGATMPGGARIHGYRFLIEERALDGTVLDRALSSVRLFPNTSDLRYRGSIHEEVQWLPDPPATSSAVVDGGPHIVHYGSDPALLPAKDERNLRLLQQRLDRDPDDAYAWYYLARQCWRMGRPGEAVMAATGALQHARALLPEHVRQLQTFTADQEAAPV